MITVTGKEDIPMGTNIGAASNSSEERIIPQGKIFAHTEIETTFEPNDCGSESTPSLERARQWYQIYAYEFQGLRLCIESYMWV